MLVNLVFDYYTDVINVPDKIGTQIKKYQKKCDKWLYNKDNNHQYWEKDEYGKKLGVGIEQVRKKWTMEKNTLLM